MDRRALESIYFGEDSDYEVVRPLKVEDFRKGRLVSSKVLENIKLGKTFKITVLEDPNCPYFSEAHLSIFEVEPKTVETVVYSPVEDGLSMWL